MAKGAKYIELTKFLNSCGKDTIKMSFDEVRDILGFDINSAYYSRSAWANTEYHPMAYGWLNAGYITEQVDMYGHIVVFRRDMGRCEPCIPMIKKKAIKGNESKLPLDIALQNIKDYYNATIRDKHYRFLSWCHCYNAFSESRHKKDENTIDYLCLHLAFYLASWGMYRGSSFLLQKDYKVHKPVVEIVLETKYDALHGITAEGLLENKNLDLLEEISKRIRRAYADEQPVANSSINNATDTLVTKILLGTLGCVPAYDRYYIQALKEYNFSTSNYCRESVMEVARYYISNKEAFEELRLRMNKGGTSYTPMKLMDMCMWQAAYSEEQ